MSREATEWMQTLRLTEYEEVESYIVAKHKLGVLSDAEFDEILREFSETAAAAADEWEPSDPALIPVLMQAAGRMKKKLLELHPELACEARQLGGGIEH
jgi:hypothetical protein